MGKRIELTNIYRPKRLTIEEINQTVIPVGKALRDEAMSKPRPLLSLIGSAEDILAHKRSMKAAQMRRWRAKQTPKTP